MTREAIEAIDRVKHILEMMPKEPPTECDYVEEWFYEDNEIRKALDMAIKALEREPCEDCMSRKAVDGLVWKYLRKATDENIAFYEHFLDLPLVTPQEPNTWSLDDAREDFMHDVYNELDFLPTNEEANSIIDIFDRVTSSIEQKPRKGHWIIDGHHRRCSECNEYFCINDAEGNEIPSSFCPNCGADMREVKE